MENGNSIWYIFGVIFLITNSFAFVMMLLDKSLARKGHRRVSEGDLFFLSICLGALGILAGMKVARHKTQKYKFIIGVPLALLQNVILLVFLARIISG